MQDVPDSVLRYLSTRDSLLQAQIVDQYPELQKQLVDPNTRSAILKWLGQEAAWEPSNLPLLLNCLEFVRGGSAEEAAVVRPFVLHPNPFVRIAAHEFLLALYYPDKNPEALLMVFQNMLSDESDKVRSLAAHYIENINVSGELKTFLERWYKNAKDTKTKDFESFERISRILGN
jgi:hypothetical protein